MQSEGPAALGLQVILPPPNCGTFEKCGATGEHDVGEQRPAKVHVRLVDGEGQHLVEPLTLIPYQVWLEQQLGGPEACWPHLGNTRLRQTGLLLLLQVPASLLPPPGAGLATYVEGAAVWQGVLHLLCLQSLILLRADGQVAGPLQWAGTQPSGGGNRDTRTQGSTLRRVRPPPAPFPTSCPASPL